MLRCFNDGVAMTIAYLAVLFLMSHRHISAAIFFSLAVSVKMNVLLMLPAFALVFVRECGAVKAITCAFLMILVQAGLGFPFLITYPYSYLTKAFELSRVFTFKWTVNWKFLDEQVFTSRDLAVALLAGHILILLLFAIKWCWKEGGLIKLIGSVLTGRDVSLPAVTSKAISQYSAHHIFSLVAICNFVGVAFARTLHYQFYSWYFHTLPFLLWHSGLPRPIALACFVGIEWAFNVFPATPSSSLILQASHLVLLVGLLLKPVPPPTELGQRKKLE
eukprot:c4099_g1_i1.p1 GENE.c4099_g1_i1~~c4099_g1_i1.p1  ORF type:complete len:276 (-),score=44.75 c4099_g1_i1:78-905(-)